MMARIFYLFCLTAASFTRLAAKERVLNQFPCTTSFIRHSNRILHSSKISTVQASNQGECVLHCAKEKSCKSINFAIKSKPASKTHRCELLQKDSYSEIEKFAVSSEFDHYDPKSPCESFPCLNGGSCVTNYINNTFTCDCQTGYHGKHCERGRCSRGWTEFQGFCYYASSYVTTWKTAQAVCTVHGGNLVKITSAAENDFVLYLSNKFAPQRKQMWIGLGYWAADKKFHWADGSLPQYTHWAPGEPNKLPGEYCGHMWTDPERKSHVHLAGTWNDLTCNVHKQIPCGYVCEKIK